MRTVTGLFAEFAGAHEAVHALAGRDYDHTELSLIAPAAATRDPVAVRSAELEDEGAAAPVSGVLGLLAGFGDLSVPEVGPVLAAGPLLGLLTGALSEPDDDEIGPWALVRALQRAGVPRRAGERLADAIGRGATLVIARTRDPYVQPIAEALADEGAAVWTHDEPPPER